MALLAGASGNTSATPGLLRAQAGQIAGTKGHATASAVVFAADLDVLLAFDDYPAVQDRPGVR